MKCVALLTGRGNNTMKDKNILPVLGKPLLYYPASAAKGCQCISDFYVSSDDDKILGEAEKIGYKPIKRPDELALPTSQHIDAIKHAIGVMHEQNCFPDILVVLLANAAIVKSGWIEKSIKLMSENQQLSAVAPVMEEMDHHPYRAKRLRNDGCLDTWFDFSGKSISTNRQDLPVNYVLCHNFWTIRLVNGNLPQTGQQPWTFMGDNVFPIVVDESFDVHEPEDLLRTEEWLRRNKDSVGYEI